MRNDRPDYHCSSVIEEKHLTNNKEGSGLNSNFSILITLSPKNIQNEMLRPERYNFLAKMNVLCQFNIV